MPNWARIIQIVTAFFKNPDKFILDQLYKGTLGKVISKYISHDVIQQVSKYKDITNLIDPETLLTMLKKMNKQETANLINDLKKLNRQELQNSLNQLTADNRNQRLLDIESLDQSQIIARNLSSSWVKKGAFIQYPNSVAGNLIIWIRSDNDKRNNGRGIERGPYIYPNVHQNTWIHMKNAKGKNGTRFNPIGAGSWMWHDFLMEWLPSQLREYIRLNKYKMNRETLDKNQRYIKTMNQRFAKLYEGPNPKYSAPIVNGQQRNYFEQSQQHAEILKIDKLEYKNQRQAIMRSSQHQLRTDKQATRAHYKANLQADLISVRTPSTQINRAINQIQTAQKSLRKVKRNINIRQQALKSIKSYKGGK